MVISEEKVYNPMVRVKREVEDLVRKVSLHIGIDQSTVRNLAILYGLPIVVTTKPPYSDDEFIELYKSIEKMLASQGVVLDEKG